jgi:protein-disulfide isomerase
MNIRTTLAALTLLAAPALAGEFNDKQKDEIGSIVRDYLLAHPEVLQEVSQALEQKQKLAEETQRTKTLKTDADKIFRNPAHFVAGNAKGDVAVTEFFDYNCGWCKKSVPEVLKLLDSDKKLKLILVDFPIFGEGSEYAARAAIAAKKQGKYWELHLAMLQYQGKVDAAVVDDLAEKKGLDLKKLKADMKDAEVETVLAQNRDLAQNLAISGTPAFIIDDQVVPGYMPMDGFQAAIAQVRAKGGCSLC